MIRTPRLVLIPCTLELLRLITHDHTSLAEQLKVRVAAGFPTYPETFEHALEFLFNHPDNAGWGVYLYVVDAERVVMGSGGFKGKPDFEGMVEIGYEVASEYRHRGYGGEAARGLVDYAFSHPEVRMVDAHTLPERNYSARILEGLGMQYIGMAFDPDEGDVWHWRITRGEWEVK